MNLLDFEQFFYQTPVIESVTTGGDFELVNLSDEEKRRAEEYVQVNHETLLRIGFRTEFFSRETVFMDWIST